MTAAIDAAAVAAAAKNIRSSAGADAEAAASCRAVVTASEDI